VPNRFRIDERNFETNAAEVENHIRRTIEINVDSFLSSRTASPEGLSALIEPMEAR
jgi:hypothetical protein